MCTTHGGGASVFSFSLSVVNKCSKLIVESRKFDVSQTAVGLHGAVRLHRRIRVAIQSWRVRTFWSRGQRVDHLVSASVKFQRSIARSTFLFGGGRWMLEKSRRNITQEIYS